VEHATNDAGILRALDDAAERASVDVADFPEAEGRIRFSTARLYARLGRERDARAHTSRALELASTDPGFDGNDRRAIRTLLDTADANQHP
jgi:hypothetical protein